MRLNGWQRIGIVASVVWVIGGPFYITHQAETEAWQAMREAYDGCVGAHNNDDERHTRCIKEAWQASDRIPRAAPLFSLNWAVAAFAPVGLGWLLGSALVYLVRWIRAGFKL